MHLQWIAVRIVLIDVVEWGDDDNVVEFVETSSQNTVNLARGQVLNDITEDG